MYKKSWNPLVDPKIATVEFMDVHGPHGYGKILGQMTNSPNRLTQLTQWRPPYQLSRKPEVRQLRSSLRQNASHGGPAIRGGRSIIQNEADLGSSYTTHAGDIPMLTTEKPRFFQVNPHTSSIRIQTSQQNKFNPYFNMSNPILTSSPVTPSYNFTSYTLILSH